jgi:hypothetical protein
MWLFALLTTATTGRGVAQNVFSPPPGRQLANLLVQTDSGKSPSTDGRLGQITGTLIDFDGKPISGAVVVLKRLGGPQRFGGPNATTDEFGRFKFDALQPGAYSFAFPSDTDDYGEPRVYRPGDTVTLKSALGGKGCVITGLVTNSAGEPVIEAPVRAIRVRSTEGAAERPVFNSPDFQSGALTDDRGIYRIWGITPGSFLVSAGGKPFQDWGPPGAFDEDVPTYYPSASLADAKVVQVVNGQEAAGIDIKYIGDPGHRITGAIRGLNHADNKNTGVMISLTQASTGRVQAMAQVRTSAESPIYTVTGVPDGEYCVSGLQVWDNDLKATSACRTIRVKGADVTGADVVLVPLASISGRLLLEQASTNSKDPDCKSSNRTAQGSPGAKGQSAPAGAATLAARVSDSVISVSSDEEPGEGSGPPLLSVFTLAAIPDGAGDFMIAKISAGRYQLNINLPSRQWYVSGVTQPGPGAKPKTIEDSVALKPGENLTGLSISVHRGAASVSGRVVTASEGKPLPPLLRVYLVPLEQDVTTKSATSAAREQSAALSTSESRTTASSHQSESSQSGSGERPAAADVPVALRYREAEVLSDGSFALANLAPGRYKLIAMPRPKNGTARSERPLTRSAEGRARLLRESRDHGTEIDLGPCGLAAGVVLKY